MLTLKCEGENYYFDTVVFLCETIHRQNMLNIFRSNLIFVIFNEDSLNFIIIIRARQLI